MRKIKLNKDAFLASLDEKKFILLGSQEITQTKYVKEKVLPKITGLDTSAVDGFWGTLGFVNDEKINWKGHLEISRKGNNNFRHNVSNEVELIKECYPHLKENPTEIHELFISFNNMDFSFPDIFTLDDIPKLRLELMLEPDQGAVCFYDTRYNTIEYIQPQATKNNNINKRDRLSYHIDIIPQNEIEPISEIPGYYKLSTTKDHNPFIVKLLRFKRSLPNNETANELNSKGLILSLEKELNTAIRNRRWYKEHEILIFDKDKNDFELAKNNQIKADKKTLFLMHGTFSSTDGSFNKLYGENSNWLKEQLSDSTDGGYEQIIAFDHPTVFYGAKENIDKLHEYLDELNVHAFEQAVDFIGISQGGLLIQQLANTNSDKIKVGKAVLVASANGVGYFTTAKYVAKFLTALKYVFKYSGLKAQSYVAALAQNSAEFLLNQPGFMVMTPGSDELYAVINNTPVDNNTRYLPIIEDYDKSIWRPSLFRFVKVLGAGAVDLIAKSMLGEYNDWVVGTKNQYIIPAEYCAIPDYNPAQYKDNMIRAIHTTSFKYVEVKETMNNFLIHNRVINNSDTSLPSYIDAHCHIFGREIITGRIIALLIEDLLSYHKNKIDTINQNHTKSSIKAIIRVITNIVKYFALNKDSYKVLNDLERQYEKLNSKVYRYTPLMFDLEMTFRNNYDSQNGNNDLQNTENSYQELIKEYLNDASSLIDKFEKANEKIFNGSLIENEEFVDKIKQLLKVLKFMGVMKPKLEENTKTGYQKQFDELKILKTRYGKNIFPFLAVDPRRENMANIILENVGKDKAFQGIKLYAPNGYSPTDPNLCDDSQGFIAGKSLYSYCIENDIAIMAHCSNAGFANFVNDLEVWGHIHTGDEKSNHTVHYDDKTKIIFNYNMLNGGMKAAVKERANTLNHPAIWRKALEKHNDLKICLAHFGGDSIVWRNNIAELIREFPNVYTDLSCMQERSELKTIRNTLLTDSKIASRLMYGSDFYFNMLDDITFKKYYKNFESIFNNNQLDKMSIDIPEEFLGI